jgi:hypothetical protein
MAGDLYQVVCETQDGLLDGEATKRVFIERHPAFGKDGNGCFVEATFRLAEEIDEDEVLEFQYLFRLARRLRQHTNPSCRTADTGSFFVPLAHLFVELLCHYGKMQCLSGMDWDDEEEVALEFEHVWSTVRFAEGEDTLIEAFVRGRSEPLQFW